MVGLLAYVSVILFIRISGKRTLAKLNAFDLVVTVALGSTLSSVLLQKSISLAQGVTALGLLIALQYLVTFLSVRSTRFAKLVRSQPSLLARHGIFYGDAMVRQRLTEDEVLSAVRAQGLQGLERGSSDPGKRRFAQHHPAAGLSNHGLNFRGRTSAGRSSDLLSQTMLRSERD